MIVYVCVSIHIYIYIYTYMYDMPFGEFNALGSMAHFARPTLSETLSLRGAKGVPRKGV